MSSLTSQHVGFMIAEKKKRLDNFEMLWLKNDKCYFLKPFGYMTTFNYKGDMEIWRNTFNEQYMSLAQSTLLFTKYLYVQSSRSGRCWCPTLMPFIKKVHISPASPSSGKLLLAKGKTV